MAESAAAEAPPATPPMPVITEAMWNKFLNLPDQIEVKTAATGLKATQLSVVQNQLNSIEKSRTTAEFLQRYADARKRWMRMNIFKNVGYALEPMEGKKGFHANVEFTEHEERSAGVSVTRQNGMTTPEVRLAHNNLFGRAWETSLMVQGPLEYHRQVILSLKAKSPLFGDFHRWAICRASRVTDMHSLKRELITGISFAVDKDNHSIEAGYNIRNAMTLMKEDEVSDDLKVDLGESDKGYLRHDCTWVQAETPKGSLFPSGLSLWTSNEVSSGIYAAKHEVKVDWYQPLHHILPFLTTLSFHAKAGLIWAFKKDACKRIRVHDRFFLDGTFVRGYTGLGPGSLDVTRADPKIQALPERVGGNVLGAASVNLGFKIPNADVVTGHCFINGGNLDYNERIEDITKPDYLKSFVNNFRYSAGVGLLFHLLPLQYGRLEVNFAMPFDPRRQPSPFYTAPISNLLFQRFRLGIHWSNN